MSSKRTTFGPAIFEALTAIESGDYKQISKKINELHPEWNVDRKSISPVLTHMYSTNDVYRKRPAPGSNWVYALTRELLDKAKPVYQTREYVKKRKTAEQPTTEELKFPELMPTEMQTEMRIKSTSRQTIVIEGIIGQISLVKGGIKIETH